MLGLISKIDRVGVFHSTDGSAYPFERVSLVYADNGCGKSTLTAILRAASESDAAAIAERPTIGTQSSPFIKLASHDNKPLVHSSGAWSGDPMQSWVFDSEFVERNVHTGGSVQPFHRANLLDFALGGSAVQHQEELSTAQGVVAAAKASLIQNESALLVYAHSADSTCTFSDFEKLKVQVDPKIDLELAESALVEGRNSARFLVQPLPAKIVGPATVFPELNELLATTLDEIHVRARALVKEHVNSLPQIPDAESWIARGLEIAVDAHCPFCGQATTGIDLVDLYAHYFNDAYRALRSRVDAMVTAIGPEARRRISTKLHADYEKATLATTGWRAYVDLPELLVTDDFDDCFDRFGKAVDGLLDVKKQRLEEVAGSKEEINALQSLFENFERPLQLINDSIEEVAAAIEDYKSSLAAANISQLELQVSVAKLAIVRKSAKVESLFTDRKVLRATLKNGDADANKARLNLKLTMEVTLNKFETAINAHLKKLSATFSIVETTASFQGGSGARSSYALRLNGQNIDVSKGEPPFRHVLSEGDKRTLAFAFFCVTVLAQPDLRGQTVIVDDPMTSLDMSRRHHTTVTLEQISHRGAQLIVLAHDPGFLREVRSKVNKQNKDLDGTLRKITEFRLDQDPSGHSSFAPVNLDMECESKYFKNYRRIRCFLEGVEFDGKKVSNDDAGESIRPLIESYLHRRFPGRIPPDKRTLGSIIGLISGAPQSSVLLFAKHLVAELTELNDFGTRYHHDASSDLPEPKPTISEVRAYAGRAFDVVHGAPIIS